MNSKQRWILIGCLATVVVLFFIGMAQENVPIEEPKSNHQVESEDTKRTVEPTVETESVEEIYAAVKLGMTEDEVRAIAGKPNMVSSSEVEGFGTMRDLIYVGGFSDNVSILLENDTVRVVIVGHVNSSGDLDTKTKM